MTNIDSIELASVAGGVQSGNSRQQRAERHQQLCRLPTPAEARRQFEEIKTWGDAKIWRKTVDAIGRECGWK
jgi:hypothetical protein